MSASIPVAQSFDIPGDTRIAIAAARWNDDLVAPLVHGCTQRLIELGVDALRVDLHRVPGAFELPLAAKWLAGTKRYRAVICIGAVVRGDTPHFDFVAGECARGVARVSLDEGLPVIFGVLTTNTQQQAIDRTGGSAGHAGKAAAEAAVEMIALGRSIKA